MSAVSPHRYSDIVEDHFASPRNLGDMDDADFVAEASNPICGDRMKLFLRVDGDRISRVSFLSQGCPAAIAASSMTTVLLTGAGREQARRLTNRDVERALGGLPRSKLHCSVLAEEVVALVLEQWDARQGTGE